MDAIGVFCMVGIEWWAAVAKVYGTVDLDGRHFLEKMGVVMRQICNHELTAAVVGGVELQMTVRLAVV